MERSLYYAVVNVRSKLRKVRPVVEPANLMDAQRLNRIQIDPAVAREIGDSPECDLLKG